MTAKDGMYILAIVVSLAFGYLLSYYIYIKKETIVEIKGNHVNFKSNRNREGDTYMIIVEGDTVRGEFSEYKGWR